MKSGRQQKFYRDEIVFIISSQSNYRGWMGKVVGITRTTKPHGHQNMCYTVEFIDGSIRMFQASDMILQGC
jgi:hypothetical protein